MSTIISVFLVYIFLFLICCGLCNNHNVLDFKIKKVADPHKIIQSFGYPAETHKIMTEDGYILTLHRIPQGQKVTERKKAPVLIMHGIASSSADFVNIDPNRSLGYILADMGYDVWLGNARGNCYSNKHFYINPYTNPKAFYDFSWHEIGSIDIPTKIDYILNVTKQNSLYYIGHSQGCTAFYVMTSMRPEYNSKIRIASLMAPPGFVTHTPESVIRILARYVDEMQAFLENLNIYHIPCLDLVRSFFQNICQSENHVAICREFYYAFGAGFGDDLQLNKTVFPLLLQTTPSDSSTKQFIHYFQEVKSGKFRQFDYGLEKNIRIYGTEHPPEYNISAIMAPVALYYGKNDRFIGVKDVQRIIKRLTNVAHDYLIPYEKFNHGDFLFATDVKPLLYDEMFRVMELY